MNVAITDACIFIDLSDLDLTASFFNLNLSIHTSIEVFNELFEANQAELNEYVLQKKLTIHNISGRERDVIQANNYPKSLSDSDKSVLYLAEKLGAIVLSSDRTVRHNAKIRSVEYHGMLWIFDKLVESSIITPGEGAQKLSSLINNNVVYLNNTELQREMKKRVNSWINR